MDIQKLIELNEDKNNGKGIASVDSIISCLLVGKTDIAKLIYRNDGDKLRAYPEIQQWMYENFGCRTHFEIDCKDDFICIPLKKYNDENLSQK